VAKLRQDGVAVRVVSMPGWELFEEQDKAYVDNVVAQAKAILQRA
jgi:transketolase